MSIHPSCTTVVTITSYWIKLGNHHEDVNTLPVDVSVVSDTVGSVSGTWDQHMTLHISQMKLCNYLSTTIQQECSQHSQTDKVIKNDLYFKCSLAMNEQ